MAEMIVEVENNTEKFKQELNRKMPELLNGIGNEFYKSIYNFMTEDKIVDTGRLRGSISYSTKYNNYSNPMMANKMSDFITGNTEDNSVVIGSNVEYASYVNSGTSKQRARKFMETGIYRSVPQTKQVVESILKE